MEFKDIYDRFRTRTNKVIIRGDEMGKDEYCMAVRIWIVNDRGEILIQQRQAEKKRWPLYWDCAVSGGVRQGETTLQASLRECREELGLHFSKQDLEYLFTVMDTRRFDDIMLVRKNLDADALVLQEEEVMAVHWASVGEVRERIIKQQFLPYSFFDYLLEVIASDIHFTVFEPDSFSRRHCLILHGTVSLAALTLVQHEDGLLNITLDSDCSGFLGVILKRIEMMNPQATRCMLTLFDATAQTDITCAALDYQKTTQGIYCKNHSLYQMIQPIFL